MDPPPDTDDLSDDDELRELDLPPLDDGTGDVVEGELELEGLAEVERAEQLLDDSVADHLDTGVVLDDDERDETDDEGGELDVGALDEGIDLAERASEGDENGLDDDAAEAAMAEAADSSDDGGDEGTTDAPEDAVDESRLPALDADEEGTEDERELAEQLLGESREGEPESDVEEPRPRARARPVALPEALVVDAAAGAGVPCAGVVAALGVVIATGDALLVVHDGGRARRVVPSLATRAGPARAGPRPDASEPPTGPLESVALAADVLAFATARGDVFWSRDLGATAAPIPGFRPARGPVELCATPGRAWIVSESRLWSFRVEDERSTEVCAGVRRAAAAGGVVVWLRTLDDGEVGLDRMRGDDERWPTRVISGAARAIAAAEGVRLAATADGRCIALAHGEDIAVSRDGGASFRVVEAVHALAQITALAFAGDGDDAPLLVAARPSVDTLRSDAVEGGRGGAVVEVTPSLDVRVVAELSNAPDGGHAEPLGVAWDASRDRLWVASGAGLFAFAAASRH